MIRSSILIAASIALSGVVLAAQTADDLKNDFARESRLLDDAIDDYGRSRAAEREAIRHLRELGEQLDSAFADPNVSVDYLNDLEARVAAARDRACTSLQLTAQARRRVYDRMERVGAVAREFDTATRLFDSTREGLDGMWHLEVRPLEIYGLVNLRLDGAQVSGPYRLSNGRRGSLNGSLSGDRLTLQVTDQERGVVGSIEAQVDVPAGEIAGKWTSLELASGLPSTGEWLATRVSSEEEIDLGN